MHRCCTVWISLSATTFFALGVGTTVWASTSQMALILFSSLPIYPLGSFLARLASSSPSRFSLGAGILKSMGFLPLSISSLWAATLPTPSLIPGHFLFCSHPPLRLPLVTSTGLCLLIFRGSRGQCTQASTLALSPSHWNMQAIYKQRFSFLLKVSLHLSFWSHSFIYQALLCPLFTLFISYFFLLIKFSLSSPFLCWHTSWKRVCTTCLSYLLCNPLFNSCSLFGFFPQHLTELLSGWSSMVC